LTQNYEVRSQNVLEIKEIIGHTLNAHHNKPPMAQNNPENGHQKEHMIVATHRIDNPRTVVVKLVDAVA
jgi:hypothetical protein